MNGPPAPPDRGPVALDPVEHRLAMERRERPRRALRGRSDIAEAAAAAALVAAAAWLLTVGHPPHATACALLIGAYAVTALVRFDVGAGYTTPTVLVLVSMLTVSDPAAVPAMVVAGFALAHAVLALTGRMGWQRGVVSAAANGWHAVGPALVLTLAGWDGTASRNGWWALPLALAAMLAFDLGSSILREPQIPARLMARQMRTVLAADALLAPVGLAIAFAAEREISLVALTAGLSVLLAAFARERSSRITGALAAEAASAEQRMLAHRLSIASQLHETVMQDLALASLHVHAANGAGDPSESIGAARRALDQGMHDMRSVIASLEGPSPTSALAGLIAEFSARSERHQCSLALQVGSTPPGRGLRAGVAAAALAAAQVGFDTGPDAHLTLTVDDAALRVRADRLAAPADERQQAAVAEMAAGLGGEFSCSSEPAPRFALELTRPFG